MSVTRALEELILPWTAPGVECSVGIGIPGFVDKERRRILRLTNFSGCDGVYLGETISADLRELGVKAVIRLENDANCAALGEGAAGAARGMSDYVVLTLGTGIGAGIVTNGRLLSGAHGMAAECGHMAVSGDPALSGCGCGGRGHLENPPPPTGWSGAPGFWGCRPSFVKYGNAAVRTKTRRTSLPQRLRRWRAESPRSR
ncbi:MAG: ROK family protein [Cloacibacillus evryensis]